MIDDESTDIRCSRTGCSLPAAWNVNWRNPRIHSRDRVKVWLSCDEHREFFEQYFLQRDFPVVISPIGETVEVVA
jgi:hypothetical protein